MREPIRDPFELKRVLWPDVRFYDKQEEIIRSLVENDKTFVRAGNMLGKDFVAGFIALSFFLKPELYFPASYVAQVEAQRNSSNANPHTVRVVTTSVKDDHLRVLWGEIGRYIQSCRVPLKREDGGVLIVNHRDIRRVVNKQRDEISYLRGMVSEKGEGMAGHHAAYTLLLIDEASGVDDTVFTQGDTWAKRVFAFGNPNPCTNFFFRTHKAGPVKDPDNGHFTTQVIRVRAEDSPSVRLGLAQSRKGKSVTHEILVPGALEYREYLKRRREWDKVRQCVGLDGEFYEGAEELLFPPEWLNLAESRTVGAGGRATMGLDSAQGGDNTSWAIARDGGLVDLVSKKTRNTAVIVPETIALANRYGVRPEDILLDAGGGGWQHADALRAKGWNVRTVAFGEAASPPLKRTYTPVDERVQEREVRYVYKNRRAEMYGLLSLRLDPDSGKSFALPSKLVNRLRGDGGPSLRGQLAPIPRMYDGEGRLVLPPKSKPNKDSTIVTLTEMLGCSPDEADALVLAVFGLDGPRVQGKVKIGAV